MHAKKAVHQDLKSKNVLLSKDWQAKLCDMGVCSLPSVNSEDLGSPGTFAYTGPEVRSVICP